MKGEDPVKCLCTFILLYVTACASGNNYFQLKLLVLCHKHRAKVPQSASRRHREKINATLEELGGLLPLPEESRSKLDKLTVLKLSVSFFQTQNYLQSGESIQ